MSRKKQATSGPNVDSELQPFVQTLTLFASARRGRDMESATPGKVDVILEHQHVEKQVVWVPPRERIVVILVGLVGSGKAGAPRIEDAYTSHVLCSPHLRMPFSTTTASSVATKTKWVGNAAK